MGSRADVSELLGACRWAEEGSYLGEVARTPGFPILVKVSRGVYQGVGQPSFANPTLVSHLLLVSAGKQMSVAAQCVKFKNQRSRVVPFGPTLVIPRDFQGHFEILSEDGRSVPALQTVDSLTRKFPDSCLVREPIKGYKPEGSKEKTGLISPEAEKHANYKISDKSRVIQPGEVLVLVGEVSVPSGKSKVTRYLRCFDSKGQTVYLNSAQKGKFSPLARQDSIGGVHTTKNILNKRMPMMVRVVDGKPPLGPLTNKSSFKFVPELRLFTTIQEELVFGLPLSQSSKDVGSILPLPLSVPLKFQVCRNMDQVEQMKEFSRIHEKVKLLVDQAKNLIQIYDINLKKELRFDGRQWKAYAPPIFLSSSTPLLSSVNDSVVPNSVPQSSPYDIPDVQDYEDIDQIYDFVRGVKPTPYVPNGGTTVVTLNQDPPIEGTTSILIGSSAKVISVGPKAPRPVRRRALSTENESNGIEERKPEPPPIETIPTHVNRLAAAAALAQATPSKPIRNNRNLHRSHGPSNVTMMVSSGNASTGSSPNNTGTSGDSCGEVAPIRTKHLYVKKHAQAQVIPSNVATSGSTTNILEPANGGLLSGSPTNRLIFRRSPIFDCRYKSMNDLNRSSLESGASGSSHKLRYFQHNHQALNLNVSASHPKHNHSHSSSNLNANVPGNSGRRKGIFRPKSLTNIMMPDDPTHHYHNLQLRGSRRDLVMPNHVHHAQIPPLDILQKFSQSQRLRRVSKPPTLYL